MRLIAPGVEIRLLGRPWCSTTATAHGALRIGVVDLFERSDPGKYRLVAWGEDKAEGESRDDLVALVLGLARNLIGSGHGRPDVGLANGG